MESVAADGEDAYDSLGLSLSLGQAVADHQRGGVAIEGAAPAIVLVHQRIAAPLPSKGLGHLFAGHEQPIAQRQRRGTIGDLWACGEDLGLFDPRPANRTSQARERHDCMVVTSISDPTLR
jgi:hypothetical protein